jgi:hypothetical protein
MTVPDEQDSWLDDKAGPVVRPYAMARGRTRPTKGKLDLISLVIATGQPPSPEVGVGPEHLDIVTLCQRPFSVAEVAAHLDLPLGTIRVLIGDLLDWHLVQVREPRPVTTLPDDSIFEQVINGLRAL